MKKVLKIVSGLLIAGGIGGLSKKIKADFKAIDEEKNQKEAEEQQKKEAEEKKAQMVENAFLSDLYSICPHFLSMEVNGIEFPINGDLPSTQQRNAVTFEIIDNGTLNIDDLKKSFSGLNNTSIRIKNNKETVSVYEGYNKVSGIQKNDYPITMIITSDNISMYNLLKSNYTRLIEKYGLEDNPYMVNKYTTSHKYDQWYRLQSWELCDCYYEEWASNIGIGQNQTVNVITVTFYRK